MASNETENLKAQLTMVTGFAALYFIFDSVWLLYIAVGIGLISLIIPAAGRGLVWGYLKIGHAMGWVNSRILLSVVYFVFLLPISLIFKVNQKNPLQLKNKGEASIWKERNHTYEPKDLENIW